MVNYITIAPPRNSMQAIWVAKPEPVEFSREEQVAIGIKNAKAAAHAREARVKAFLEQKCSKGATFDSLSYVSTQQSSETSFGGSALTASPSSCQGSVFRLFSMSVSGALNNLLSVASRTSSADPDSSVAAATADGIGPALLQGLGVRLAPGSALTADAANVFELYLIVDTVARCAPLDSEGLLDAYMLIHFAVSAGYKLSPENMRPTLVAALSIAHKRAAGKLKQPKEYAIAFAARCLPSLNLQDLAATEYMLSQKLKFDLRCLDEEVDRQVCVEELGMIAAHYKEVFVNYLQIIFRSEKRMRELGLHAGDVLQRS